MKTVQGVGPAREALTALRMTSMSEVPPHVQQRTKEAFGESLTPQQVVNKIVRSVKSSGDTAIRDLSRRLDGTILDRLEVPRPEIKQAYDRVPDELISALRLAERRVRRYQEATLPQGWMDLSEGYGESVQAVERVGAYIPGGTAPLMSTAIMTVVPARVAGVNEIIVTTPSGPRGTVDPRLLVAADIASADRVFRIGGAPAIAAMAFGTEEVPRVDIVCGPGNLFVTMAKKLVYGEVGIDGLYGPTETIIIADESGNPTLCAADLLAQSEHDELATPVLITTSEALAEHVGREIEVRIKRLEREAIASASIDLRGCIAIVSNIGDAITLANEFATEHLSLMVKDAESYIQDVRNAGIVFVGEFSHEVLGDYVAGPSHVMPTGGTARFSSGVNVRSFLRFIPIVNLDRKTASKITGPASVIGRSEGLTGHAEAAEIRHELSTNISQMEE